MKNNQYKIVFIKIKTSNPGSWYFRYVNQIIPLRENYMKSDYEQGSRTYLRIATLGLPKFVFDFEDKDDGDFYFNYQDFEIIDKASYDFLQLSLSYSSKEEFIDNYFPTKAFLNIV